MMMEIQNCKNREKLCEKGVFRHEKQFVKTDVFDEKITNIRRFYFLLYIMCGKVNF